MITVGKEIATPGIGAGTAPNWPTSDYEEVTVSGRPSSGELDNECKAKEDKGECSKWFDWQVILLAKLFY